jgi:hypothetical protein
MLDTDYLTGRSRQSRTRSARTSPRRSPVKAAVKKMAPSCSSAALRTIAQTS